MASVLQYPEVIDGNHTGNGFVREEVRRLAEHSRTNRERQRQVLNLERQRVLSLERSQPGRRVALEAALAQIEGQIARLI